MSRYTNVDALIEKYYKQMDELMESTSEHLSAEALSLLCGFTLINSAPSIDIVRCKECKWLRYCETEDLDLYLDCDKPDGGGIPRNEDWFCADGERREP